MQNSKIEWTDHTFNPWMGCQKISPGCDHCYAEAMMDHRYGRVEWGPHGTRIRTGEANWQKPLAWNRATIEEGVRRRVFAASLADIWDNKVPDEWRKDLFALIDQTRHLDWLLLTKRPKNMRRMLPKALSGHRSWPWPNVWLGVTAEDQEHYERRWSILRDVPAAKRFVSYEPALGPLTISGQGTTPNWIICGGESGRGARLMKPSWARALLCECRENDVAFFMKQMTGKTPIPEDLVVREFPKLRVEI